MADVVLFLAGLVVVGVIIYAIWLNRRKKYPIASTMCCVQAQQKKIEDKFLEIQKDHEHIKGMMNKLQQTIEYAIKLSEQEPDEKV